MSKIDKIHPGMYELNVLITDLYNHVYARTGEYDTKFFDIGDLNLERFKFSDYNLDTIFSNESKVTYGGESHVGIRSDFVDPSTELKQLYFKRQSSTHPVHMRLIEYSNKEEINDMTSPINVNIILRTLLSELVVNGKTSGLLLPIINVDIKGSDLADYEVTKDKIQNKAYYNLQLTEKFFGLLTLEKFMTSAPLDLRIFKTILYQIIDVLYEINNVYSNFRYNQLLPKKIDCYLKKLPDGELLPEIKLSNFYLAEIPGTVDNKYVKNLELPPIYHPYFDLYTFFNYIYHAHTNDITKHPELVQFFDKYLPFVLRSTSTNYLNQEIWDNLSDEQKNDLRIKNIKNDQLFTSKDSLSGVEFVETAPIMDELSGGKEQPKGKSSNTKSSNTKSSNTK